MTDRNLLNYDDEGEYIEEDTVSVKRVAEIEDMEDDHEINPKRFKTNFQR